ncbi:Lipoprotein-releasing system transmembrane protein lolE,outer membrane-specific lipoprotein transporter subunit LolE,lipoprotein releasing system, transmembrane protein, LolC/E family,FtsX-like permease family [Chlamydia serpentis]|uniref:ABC3 transporter permease C-terminal domain-containing protein n=1 Tax=Chlamydia serpentis TaxID=1967782 RepID=A0A2R8FAE2_9CHLA|nr:FtsX-like permease family protein [Chlamydia serpentis]SPN73400.1 Lipoprotein-releasing system transmembrane protein lolE,outer membrane-specific lipoprotein transporter subunit LolE,lipoprotein releasing system, transmembrane protein, LolC/E family,FtsX-like permease family [Chlamydia serpentis]
MKLEFSIALKYLIPRKGRLSAAIVSIFSIGIISLVVWLSVVFISVIYGLEQRWLNDLSQLHSPVTMVPSEAYYSSYYYQIDRHSELSNYTTKTLGEKIASLQIDPYDPELDYLLPETFPKKDCDVTGQQKDPVKMVVESLSPYLKSQNAQIMEFEEGMGYLHIDTSVKLKKPQSRTLIHFLTYPSKPSYEDKVLPYDETDYTSNELNPFNRSSLGWKTDFHRLEELYRGSSIILPNSYKESGYKVGDIGFFSTYSIEAQKETQYKVHVIGFYNPGLSPLGGKTVFIDPDLAGSIRAQSEGLGMNNGFHIFFPNIKRISFIKNHIEKILSSLEIKDYWDTSSIYDYEYFRPILDQLQSDQVLFLFVSILILIVACSNVVTMSVLLVNNKKKEIGILKAMGVSSRSLKVIFACCGAFSGAFGVIIGMIFAMISLKNLGLIVKALNYLQGRETFNAAFFGQNLPNTVHPQAVYFLGFGTLILAAISGVLPARKVAKMHVSEILKAD